MYFPALQKLFSNTAVKDVIVRYGADEFAIIMINTPNKEAMEKLIAISKRLLKNLTDLRWTLRLAGKNQDGGRFKRYTAKCRKSRH